MKETIMNKKMMAIMAPLALVGTMLFSTATFAQYYRPTHTPGITTNQQNQRSRISEGRYSGQLTRAEAERLRAEEFRIQQQKMAAKSDGVVTRSERQQIH